MAVPFFKLGYFLIMDVFLHYAGGLNYFGFLNSALCREVSETCDHNLHSAITFSPERRQKSEILC